MIDHIKDKKHESFVFQINKESEKIDEENFKIFGRLNEKKAVSRLSKSNKTLSEVKERKETDHYIKNWEKERSISKENEKMMKRIQLSASSIKTSKLFNEEKKRKEIRDRIRKYTPNSELKSERYFVTGSNKKQSSLSCSFAKTRDLKNDLSSTFSPKASADYHIGKSNKKTFSFYNAQNIVKNRIENFGLKGRRNLKESERFSRPYTVEVGRRQIEEQEKVGKDSFCFPTETN